MEKKIDKKIMDFIRQVKRSSIENDMTYYELVTSLMSLVAEVCHFCRISQENYEELLEESLRVYAKHHNTGPANPEKKSEACK